MKRKRETTDTGPLIHLEEINAEKVWNLFPAINVPDVVIAEIKFQPTEGNQTIKDKRFKVVKTNNKILKISKRLFDEYDMGKNDSIILAHSIYNESEMLFTDDLELRNIARLEGVKPVGTAGILYLAFLYDMITYDALFEYLDLLVTDSSLFITRDIIEKIKHAANEDMKM